MQYFRFYEKGNVRTVVPLIMMLGEREFMYDEALNLTEFMNEGDESLHGQGDLPLL